MARINWQERDWRDRCPTTFERRTPGKRYVNARWRCPRPKMKGLPYCSYCEPYSEKRARLEAKRAKEKAPSS
jgi:hypothetical protein